MVSRPAAILALAVVLTACVDNTRVSVRFDNTGALYAGAPVYLDAVRAGQVVRLRRMEAGTDVSLALDPELTSALRSESAALLVERDGRTALRLFNHPGGEAVLRDGDRLTGLHGGLELAAWQTGMVMETGARSVARIAGAFNRYFVSEEWAQQKDRISEQLRELQTELADTLALSRRTLRQYLEDLESESEALRQQARAGLEQLVLRLRDELAGLERDSDRQLIAPLERLLDDLSRALATGPRQERV